MEVPHIIEPTVEANSTRRKSRFWQRQFALEATTPQIVFDVIFGIIGPILCFVFDPFVFRGGLIGRPLLPEYQTFVYLFSGLQIALLVLWLATGPGLQLWNRFISGMLLAGSVFCFTLGLVLSPFSFFGLSVGIGLFGFTPFLSSLVYLRNSARAARAETYHASNFSRSATVVFGFLLGFGLPTLLSVPIDQAINRAIDEIMHGDPQQAALATHRLMPLRFFAGAELDQLADAYAAESDDRRKEILKSSYREITGENIEDRIRNLD